MRINSFHPIKMNGRKPRIRKTIFFTFIFFLLLCMVAEKVKAQIPDSVTGRTIFDKITVSGLVQVEYQHGGKDAALTVGNPANEHPDKSFGRIGIRRGRVRLAYAERLFSLVYQMDVTERSIGIRDAFADIYLPGNRNTYIRGGLFSRPFGNEITFSSSRRESPERALVFRTLFPGERDLGGMIVLQAPESSPWNILKFEGGFFAGNGINWETDSRMDFIGRFTVSETFNRFGFRGGLSYYRGSVYQGTENVYTMSDNSFRQSRDAANTGKYARREYFGLEGEFTYGIPGLGETIIRSEYLWGQQPGSENSSVSPNSSFLPEHDTYIRHFNGGYIYFVQNMNQIIPLTAVFKFDWYDPNTKAKGNEIGETAKGTTSADLWRRSIGFGAIWNFNERFLAMAFYNFNNNERTPNIEDFEDNRKSGVFTLRLQFRF